MFTPKPSTLTVQLPVGTAPSSPPDYAYGSYEEENLPIVNRQSLRQSVRSSQLRIEAPSLNSVRPLLDDINQHCQLTLKALKIAHQPPKPTKFIAHQSGSGPHVFHLKPNKNSRYQQTCACITALIASVNVYNARFNDPSTIPEEERYLGKFYHLVSEEELSAAILAESAIYDSQIEDLRKASLVSLTGGGSVQDAVFATMQHVDALYKDVLIKQGIPQNTNGCFGSCSFL